MGASLMIRQGDNLQTDPAKPWFDHTSALGLHASFATLQAGCHYLIARGANPPPAPRPLKPQVLMRVSGNHLKELDRFFSLLIAEYRAFLRGMAPRAYRRQPADLHPLDKYRPRLRAIRRLQIVACDGPVRNHCAITARDLAMASLGLAGGRPTTGQPFVIDDGSLAEIARFYLILAADVVGLS
jgi:hypothetical protein